MPVKKKSTKKDVRGQARSAVQDVWWVYWEWAPSAAKNYLIQGGFLCTSDLEWF